jgi:hypothetical protein
MANKYTIVAYGTLFLMLCACKSTILPNYTFVKDGFGKQFPEFMKLHPEIDLYRNFDRRKVYKLVFEEKFVDNRSIRQTANLPKEAPIETENYFDPKGNYQELYLVKYEDTLMGKTRSPEVKKQHDTLMVVNSQELDTIFYRSMFIFYSFKFNAKKECIGAAPIRIGKMGRYLKNNTSDSLAQYIALDHVVDVQAEKIQGQDDKYNFKIGSIKKNKEPVWFILSVNTDERVVVSKIVSNHKNKIGGQKPLIYDMKIIPGGKLLEFKRVATQQCYYFEKSSEFYCHEIKEKGIGERVSGPHYQLAECCEHCDCPTPPKK